MGKWRITITFAGALVCALVLCNSYIVIAINDHARARCERQIELSAPLAAGSSFAAQTGDGSITIR